MIRGYGNNSDPPKVDRDESIDLPPSTKSAARKILDTLPPSPRDTPGNRRMAKINGWTDEEFDDWANGETGDDPNIREG